MAQSLEKLWRPSGAHWKGLTIVVNREDVNLVIADQTIDDTIRPFDDFPDGAALELRNDPPRLSEVPQASDSPNQPGDDDGGVVWGVLLDECADRRQVRDSLIGPVNRRHARKRFSTSS